MTNIERLLGLIPKEHNHLSVLKFADRHSITYFSGDDEQSVAHLQNCTLLCKVNFHPNLRNVELIHCEDPQLSFYLLSQAYKENYLDYSVMTLRDGAYIHPEAIIAESCSIGPGSVIGKCYLGEDVTIDANCVIYSKTEISMGSIIEPNTVIGATGVMWVWNGSERVFLEQLGGVIIGEGCFIGSNVSIVRGSANEMTTVGANTCISHGTKIGHGSRIGTNNHFANNVSIGGSVVSGEGCFFGSGCTVSPGKALTGEVIVGAGTVVTKNVNESGVYFGVPAKRLGNIKASMSGVPVWKKV